MSEEQPSTEKQLTLGEFNEINYDALHTLGVHYFAEILKENEILKKPIYLFIFVKRHLLEEMSGNNIFSLVRSHTLEEAIDKIIYNPDLFLKIFLHIFNANHTGGHTKETNDYRQQLANLNIITKDKKIFGLTFWVIDQNNEDFDQNYKKFIEQNYETLCKYFIENKDHQREIGIHKIDKIL